MSAVREDEADHDDVVLQDLVVELQPLSILVNQFDVGKVIPSLCLGSGLVGRCVAGDGGRGCEQENRCKGSGPGKQVNSRFEHAAASRISILVRVV
jgi:hypothetical protein